MMAIANDSNANKIDQALLVKWASVQNPFVDLRRKNKCARDRQAMATPRQ